MQRREVLTHGSIVRRHFLVGSAALAGAVFSPFRRLFAKTASGTIAFGNITTVVGGGALRNGSPAQEVAIGSPFGLGIDPANNLYICDNYYQRIYRVNYATEIFTTVAGSGVPGDTGDGGPATAASLNFPYGVAADENANLSIADANNNRVRWVSRKDGIISTAAGTGVPGFNGDDISAFAALSSGLAVDRKTLLFCLK